jgi:competence protein ComEC
MQFDVKYYLAQIPLVRLLLPFISGVILGIYSNFHLAFYTSAIVFICFGVTSYILKRNKSLKNLRTRIWLTSILLYLCIFVTGILLSGTHKQIERENHFSNYYDKDVILEVQVKKPPTKKSRSLKIIGEVRKSLTDGKIIQTSGKILLYVKKDSLSQQIKYGDVLVIQPKLQEIAPPMNPMEFNYKQYLSFQNIYHQSYLNEQSWRFAGLNKGNFLLSKIFFLREKLKTVLNTYLNGKEEKAVAHAILIGNKDLLDDKLTQTYATSGAMHVLAVSGLHVGIIYLVFSYMLSFLKKTRLAIYLPFILIGLIWFYALITGGSPSVLRASTMFSFITLGTSFKRHLNIYNAIAASLFVLICVNPFIITEVGFQLSYLAVIGIIFLQPKIYNLYLPSNWILDKIWVITAVSIAAQIATFPLGILYFHQFPNLFWVSNLVVIPAATIIVYLGVTLFAISWAPPIALFTGKVLEFLIRILNGFVGIVDSIPYSLTSGLDITILETWLIYCFIVLGALALSFRIKSALYASLFALFIFSLSYSLKNWKSIHQKKLIVYHVPKISGIELIHGKEAVSIFDNALINDKSQLLFRVKHNWWKMKIKNHLPPNEAPFIKSTLYENNKLILFENKKILIIDSAFTLPNEVFHTDYLIVSHNPKLYLKKAADKIKAQYFIFDSSNSYHKIKYWKKDCEDLCLNCYFVTENKAFIADFN